MTRLINADELEKRLQDFKEWEDCDGNTLHTMSERQRISKCIEISRERPIAYDVDKVVEELEELRETYCRLQLSTADDVQIQKLQYSQNAISKAIEIVKAGGTK